MRYNSFPFHFKLCEEKVDIFGLIDMIVCFSNKDSITAIQPDFNFHEDAVLKEIAASDCCAFMGGIDEDSDSWPIKNYYTGYENVLLKLFSRYIKNCLESPVFDDTKILIEEELSSMSFDIHVDECNVAKLFVGIQNSFLQDEVPDEHLTQTLHRLVAPDNILDLSLDQNKTWQFILKYLFKFFPKDFDSMCKHFEQLYTNTEYAKIKICYSYIGDLGMKQVMCSLINKYKSKPDIVDPLRHYSGLFCAAVDLLNRLPEPAKIYTKRASDLLLIALVRCTYALGRIDREKDFYSEASLDFMSSLGPSHGAKKKHGPKNSNYDKLVKEAEDLWENGDKRMHNVMADYLLNKYEDINNVRRKPLLEKLAVVGKKYGRVRGMKKGK
ncbi:hypothetical protein [Desulfovibrio sp. TomC]|uniref:hypothetical protein n=1 Tax=Desulfovibrio sp. TomC TaxID=1562888 RepID=UPI0012E2C1C5|nr:hypothetical protein [Desulfovibrio sp. TomC]